MAGYLEERGAGGNPYGFPTVCPSPIIMPGLDPGILCVATKEDGRDEPGHDDVWVLALCGSGPHLSRTTFWPCSPSPSMPSRMVSPGLRKRCGFMPMPTPGGVPVVMMSPGISVKNCER